MHNLLLIYQTTFFIVQHINTFEQEAKSLTNKIIFRNIFSCCKEHIWWTVAIIFVLVSLIVGAVESVPTTSNDVKKCKQAILVAWEKNDQDKVVDLFKDFNGDEEQMAAIAENIVLKCIETNQITTAEQINHYYPSRTDKILIDFYLQQEQFNKVLDKGNDYTMGSLIKECVTYLCENNKKDKAYKFVKQNADRIHEYSDGSGSMDELVNGRGITRKKIVNYLNEYIRNY